MNYVYTLLLQKLGITVAMREQVKGVQGGEKNITSIHILAPLFYKDSPRLVPSHPYNTNDDKRNDTWSKKQQIINI